MLGKKWQFSKQFYLLAAPYSTILADVLELVSDLVDYMMKVVKSPIPIQVFTIKKEALEWLLSIKKSLTHETNIDMLKT